MLNGKREFVLHDLLEKVWLFVASCLMCVNSLYSTGTLSLATEPVNMNKQAIKQTNTNTLKKIHNIVTCYWAIIS